MEQALLAIEPYLQYARLFTHQIPDPLVKAGSQLIGPLAFQRLVIDLDFTAADSAELFKYSISKLIGIGIISASSIVKIPQIFAILKSQDVRLLSFTGYALEALTYIITCAYNFRVGNAFSTFGETAMLCVQNIVIMLLIMYFSGNIRFLQVFVSIVFGILFSLFAPPESIASPPDSWLARLFMLTVPLSIVSKIPQLLSNFRLKSTGTLSGISVFSGVLGSLARIFTTLASNVSDKAILIGYIVAGLLNVVLGLQMILYGASKKSRKPKAD